MIRLPFEEVNEQSYIDLLADGDIVFIDNSHRSFQNSDVTVFFTEALPAFPRGVIYGIHDIFLPQDYPSDWLQRFYNEQYLLASYLLGGADGDKILFPAFYVYNEFRRETDLLFADDYYNGLGRHGGAFWMQRSGIR